MRGEEDELITESLVACLVGMVRNLFQMLDTEDKGYIKFEEYLVGIAILNEQVGTHYPLSSWWSCDYSWG